MEECVVVVGAVVAVPGDDLRLIRAPQPKAVLADRMLTELLDRVRISAVGGAGAGKEACTEASEDVTPPQGRLHGGIHSVAGRVRRSWGQ